MLPRIPSLVQIIEVGRERERDTQSVFPHLREGERERFPSDKEESYEDISDKENHPPGNQAYENVPPPFLGFAPTPCDAELHGPPAPGAESHVVNASCPPHSCAAREVFPNGPWRRHLPLARPVAAAHAPGEAARAPPGSRDASSPYHNIAAGLPPLNKERGRKTWKDKMRSGFRRIFRKRSPPPLPTPPLIYANVMGQFVGNVQHPPGKKHRGRKG